MKSNKLLIPVCFFPTTALLVDDNMQYITQLIPLLNARKAHYNLHNNPDSAIEFLKKYKPDPFIQRCILRPEEDKFNQRNVVIDINAIPREMYNDKRSDEVSIFVSDYDMQTKIKGTDLCQLVKQMHPGIKTLMLTGVANAEKAVDAFNAGIIDKFIRKDSNDFQNVLNNAIDELLNAYFLDLSKVVIESLTKDLDHPTILWLDEPKFPDIFNKIYSKSGAVEYYLSDGFGSYTFLTEIAKPSWLICKDEEDMRAVYEMAEDSDTPFPNDLLKAMEKREKVLYLPGGDLIFDPKDAGKVLHPATKLVGDKTTYYYAYVDDPKAYDINPEKILSYAAYREKRVKK